MVQIQKTNENKEKNTGQSQLQQHEQRGRSHCIITEFTQRYRQFGGKRVLYTCNCFKYIDRPFCLGTDDIRS